MYTLLQLFLVWCFFPFHPCCCLFLKSLYWLVALRLRCTLCNFLQSFYCCTTFFRGGGWLPPCALQGTETSDPASGHRALLSEELVGVEELNRTALFRRRCGWSALVLFHQYELRWMSLRRPDHCILCIVCLRTS